VRVRRTGAADAAFDTALAAAGAEVTADLDATLVHVLAVPGGLDDVTPALTDWAAQARSTVAAGGDVVAVVDQRGFDDADAPAAMVAHGVVAGTRALAMERARDGGRANLVVRGDAPADEVAATVAWLASVPSVTAEVVHVGGAMHGRQRP
jgi:hypothetical protein